MEAVEASTSGGSAAAASTPSQQSTAATEAQEAEKPVFSCAICGLVETCDYYGNTPPFTKPIGFVLLLSIIIVLRVTSFLYSFKENVYVMRDPFSPPGTKSSTSYLLLGGECSICGASVCADQVTVPSMFILLLNTLFFRPRVVSFTRNDFAFDVPSTTINAFQLRFKKYPTPTICPSLVSAISGNFKNCCIT